MRFEWHCLTLSLLVERRRSGRALVIDGDTLDIGTTRFRLNGIDAPELGTAAGTNARIALQNTIDGRIVGLLRRFSSAAPGGSSVNESLHFHRLRISSTM